MLAGDGGSGRVLAIGNVHRRGEVAGLRWVAGDGRFTSGGAGRLSWRSGLGRTGLRRTGGSRRDGRRRAPAQRFLAARRLALVVGVEVVTRGFRVVVDRLRRCRRLRLQIASGRWGRRRTRLGLMILVGRARSVAGTRRLSMLVSSISRLVGADMVAVASRLGGLVTSTGRLVGARALSMLVAFTSRLLRTRRVIAARHSSLRRLRRLGALTSGLVRSEWLAVSGHFSLGTLRELVVLNCGLVDTGWLVVTRHLSLLIVTATGRLAHAGSIKLARVALLVTVAGGLVLSLSSVVGNVLTGLNEPCLTVGLARANVASVEIVRPATRLSPSVALAGSTALIVAVRLATRLRPRLAVGRARGNDGTGPLDLRRSFNDAWRGRRQLGHGNVARLVAQGRLARLMGGMLRTTVLVGDGAIVRLPIAL